MSKTGKAAGLARAGWADMMEGFREATGGGEAALRPKERLLWVSREEVENRATDPRST